MEQDKLKMLEVTLKELRDKVLADEDIKKMFLKNFPKLNFEEAVEITLTDLMEYALEKDYDVLSLSLKGADLFFSSVLSNLEDEEDEKEFEDISKESGDKYGKA